MNVVKQEYPLRFFMDKLSSQLNAQYIGCSTGDVVVNHMLYADDVPLFTPRSMMIGSDQLNFFFFRITLILVILSVMTCLTNPI